MTDWRVIQGDAREVLRTLPDESVQMCITSPAYWGLRNYGTEPQIWGGDPACEHEWGSAGASVLTPQTAYETGRASGSAWGPSVKLAGMGAQSVSHGAFCRCGAWRGELGLEPTPELYVAHLVEVFREVRRVLRKDGTLWLNLGDCYANSGQTGLNVKSATSTLGPKRDGLSVNNAAWNRTRPQQVVPSGLKQKDLVGVPWRVAFALQADGWWLRSAITWCKVAPMPESVRDRPTSATEMVFMLTKSAGYFYDAIAVAEPTGSQAVLHMRQDLADLGLLPTSQWAESGSDVQGLRQAESDSLAANSEGCRVSAQDDAQVQRQPTRQDQAPNIQSVAPAQGAGADLRAVSERESGSGAVPTVGEAPGCTASVLRGREGERKHPPLPGDTEGEGIPSAQYPQAAWATQGNDQHADGGRMGRHQATVRVPLRPLQPDRSTADERPHHTVIERWASHEGERPASMSQLQLKAGQSAPSTRNMRNYWLLSPEPFPAAHFAVMPTELCRRAILAGTSAKGACAQCGAPWRREVERTKGDTETVMRPKAQGQAGYGSPTSTLSLSGNGSREWAERGTQISTVGWSPSCSCDDAGETVPSVVLDPFCGAGTAGLVAHRLGRAFIGIELKAEYVEMARRRIYDDAPLFTAAAT